MSGDGASGGEMETRRDSFYDDFARAARTALVSAPDPERTATLVPMLAETARASTIEAESAAVTARPARRRGIRLAAQIAFAVALIPVLFAGLAVAGVKLPGPAQDAFESLGITLPNQDSDTGRTSDDGGSEAGAPANGGSDEAGGGSGAPGDATPGVGKGRPEGAPSHGKGKPDGTPGLGTDGAPGQGGSVPGGGKDSAPGLNDDPGPPAAPPGQGQGQSGDRGQSGTKGAGDGAPSPPAAKPVE